MLQNTTLATQRWEHQYLHWQFERAQYLTLEDRHLCTNIHGLSHNRESVRRQPTHRLALNSTLACMHSES